MELPRFFYMLKQNAATRYVLDWQSLVGGGRLREVVTHGGSTALLQISRGLFARGSRLQEIPSTVVVWHDCGILSRLNESYTHLLLIIITMSPSRLSSWVVSDVHLALIRNDTRLLNTLIIS